MSVSTFVAAVMLFIVFDVDVVVLAFMCIHKKKYSQKGVSDWCLMPTQQFFRYIMARTN